METAWAAVIAMVLAAVALVVVAVVSARHHRRCGSSMLGALFGTDSPPPAGIPADQMPISGVMYDYFSTGTTANCDTQACGKVSNVYPLYWSGIPTLTGTVDPLTVQRSIVAGMADASVKGEPWITTDDSGGTTVLSMCPAGSYLIGLSTYAVAGDTTCGPGCGSDRNNDPALATGLQAKCWPILPPQGDFLDGTLDPIVKVGSNPGGHDIGDILNVDVSAGYIAANGPNPNGYGLNAFLMGNDGDGFVKVGGERYVGQGYLFSTGPHVKATQSESADPDSPDCPGTDPSSPQFTCPLGNLGTAADDVWTAFQTIRDAAPLVVSDPTCTGVATLNRAGDPDDNGTNPTNFSNVADLAQQPSFQAANASCDAHAKALCAAADPDNPYCACVNAKPIPGAASYFHLPEPLSVRCLSEGGCMRAQPQEAWMPFATADAGSECPTLDVKMCDILFEMSAQMISGLPSVVTDCGDHPGTCAECKQADGTSLGGGPCVSNTTVDGVSVCTPKDPTTQACPAGFHECDPSPEPGPGPGPGPSPPTPPSDPTQHAAVIPIAVGSVAALIVLALGVSAHYRRRRG